MVLVNHLAIDLGFRRFLGSIQCALTFLDTPGFLLGLLFLELLIGGCFGDDVREEFEVIYS